MKPITLSPSTLSLFLECPRCFWLHVIKGIKRPPVVFPSLPSGMDRILKEHFDQHRREKSRPEELEGLKGKLFPDLKKLNEWRNTRKGLCFSDPRTSISLMGAIDDLFITEKGLHAPIDFKTRGYPLKPDTHEHYRSQMEIYSFLLEKNSLKPAGFALLLFYHPKRVNEHCNVEFHAETIKITAKPEDGERIFRDAVKVLKGKMPRKSKDCWFCNWKN